VGSGARGVVWKTPDLNIRSGAKRGWMVGAGCSLRFEAAVKESVGNADG
jgi:hypothetical protein